LARLGLAYVQPDISKVGGLLRFIEVVKAVNGLGKSVAPHHRPHKSILAHTYTLHVASVIDNITLVEWPLAWINEIYDEEVTVRNGEIDITNLAKKKGVGLGIREEILSKYPYEKKHTTNLPLNTSLPLRSMRDLGPLRLLGRRLGLVLMGLVVG